METMLELHGLKKNFKRPDGTIVEAVKGIDLEVHKGEIFSLLGPNGAGKTTTISMISGLLEPTEGDAIIGGYSIRQNPIQAKALMGVVPQEIALYPTLTARQNLEFFGRMYGLSGRELAKQVDWVLDFIDLRDRQKDKINTFSGGMKRRVNIGIGLLHHPQLLYMDEPTVGIDPQSRRRILDTVLQLRDELGMTVLYTTHLMEEAEELSDRVGIIDHGKIIAMGTQGELTLMVGEEDRLLCKVASTDLPEAVIERIKNDVEGVTAVDFEQRDGHRTSADVEPTETGTVRAVRPEGLITIHAKRGRKALPRVLEILIGQGIEVQSVEIREPDLEAVFLHLTGRELRD